MCSQKNLPAPLQQSSDLDAAYIFEAGLTELELAFVQLLKGTRDHPGLTQAEFEILAAPLLADLRRAVPPQAPGLGFHTPLPHLRPLEVTLAPPPHP